MSAAPPRRPAPPLLDQIHAGERERGFVQILEPLTQGAALQLKAEAMTQPKSPGEPLAAFAFDPAQLAALAEEAMRFSQAEPGDDARILEGAARLAAASGFLGASLLEADWCEEQLARLLGSSSEAGLAVFEASFAEAQTEAQTTPQVDPEEEDDEDPFLTLKVDPRQVMEHADEAMLPYFSATDAAMAGAVAHLAAAVGLLGAGLTLSPDWSFERLKSLIDRSLCLGVDLAEEVSREGRPGPDPRGANIRPFPLRS